MLGAGGPGRHAEVRRERRGDLLGQAAVGGLQRRELAALQRGNSGTIGPEALARSVPYLVVAALTRVEIIVVVAPDEALVAESAPWLRHAISLHDGMPIAPVRPGALRPPAQKHDP